MKPRPIIAGNWKMYKTAKEAREFISLFAPLIAGQTTCRILLAVPFTALAQAAEAARTTEIVIGGQNMHDAVEGAFTGEISARMLQDAGAQFVLLGHSERRQFFHEDDALINRKVKRALAAGLQPIVCIGESEKEREKGLTEEVLTGQLGKGLQDLSPQDLEKIVIAYEPVWAIGTGKTATPELVQASHLICRTFLARKWGKQTAERIPLLYGGSVKPDNVKALMQQPAIDGALVGGASLDPHLFAQLVKNSA